MDFFARQDHARKLTGRLVWLFALAVLGTVVAVNLLTYAGVEWYLTETGVRGDRPLQVEAAPGQRTGPWVTDLHLKAQLAATLATLAIIALGSLYKTAQLRGGGPAVAVSLGGRPGRPDSDPREKQLVNIVEEMSIASGVPMPQVYVLDREEGINAFAAGLGQRDAVVAVTGGALTRFTRDELQAVIGHEFSHILNGDMRINLRLMGLPTRAPCMVSTVEVLAVERAMPKSANLARPSVLAKRLAGFRSRCTSCRRWASASAPAMWWMMVSARGSGRPRPSASSLRSSHGTNSSTM